MAHATWAWRLLRGSPWVLKYPYCHQMITQTHPRGDGQVSEKIEFSENCQVTLNSLTSVKTAKSSLARGHVGGGGGGATGGTRSWDPGPPPWVRGSIYKKKVLQDLGLNPHTAAAIRKEVLKPPPPTPDPHPPPPAPPPQKRGTRVRGGWGVKIEKFIRGSFFLLK